MACGHVTLQAQQLSGGSSSTRVGAVVTKIMHVFADALPHVPAHRRVPVLAQLVTLLGPAHYLWVLMALLFKLHATQAAGVASDKVGRQSFFGRLYVRTVHQCACLCVRSGSSPAD